MNTIEERAKEYTSDPFLAALERKAYIAGATEQKAIDIMRIRQFLEREAAYNGSMSYVDDLLIEELCKAVEEQK